MENNNFKWFKHSISAQFNPPVRRVFKEFGVYGVGAFWLLTEILCDKGEITFQYAKTNYASRHFPADKLRSLIEDFGFFSMDDEEIVRLTDAAMAWLTNPEEGWKVEPVKQVTADNAQSVAGECQQMASECQQMAGECQQMAGECQVAAGDGQIAASECQQSTSNACVRKEREKDKDKEKEKKKSKSKREKEIARSPYNDHPEDSQEVLDFKRMMRDYYPRVCKLETPLTFEQMEQVKKEFPHDLIKTKLMNMENHKQLHKQYSSAYITLLNWCRMEIKNPKGAL